MADHFSDSAGPHANIPSSQSKPKRHKNRNRKHSEQPTPAHDGTVSDGALTNSIAPSWPQGGHKPSQSPGPSTTLPQHRGNAGREQERHTRPVSVGGGGGLLATPGKERAYAGATFQASPAPSSLPVPKFFSRSVPNIAAQPSLQGRLAGARTPEASDSSPEAAVAVPVPPPRDGQQSPLDIFFKADRAEREKSRSGSNLFSPLSPIGSPSLPNDRTALNSELDGKLSSLPSPRAIPPRDVFNPSTRPQSSSGGRETSTGSDQNRLQSQTDSLKAVLFNTAADLHSTPPLIRSKSGPNTPDSSYHTPSSWHKSPSSSMTPVSSADKQSDLHYGNRNLSPLFKAARGETPKHPSSLRQEMLNERAPHADLGDDFGPAASSTSTAQPDGRARRHLDQQVRASAPAEMPPLPFVTGNGISSGSPSHDHRRISQHGASGRSTSASASASATEAPSAMDNKALEENLRRLLKIN